MEKIIITTDSGCFTTSLEKNNNVLVIPSLVVDSNGKSYRDGIEINNEETLERLSKGEIFKTSSPYMGDFSDTFEKALSKGENVIHISMSYDISSGSYNGAMSCASDMNNKYNRKCVHVINSKQGGVGGTLVVRKVQELIENEMSPEEIIDYIENKYIPMIYTSFLVPNPAGFIRCGRDRSSLAMKDKIKLLSVKTAKILSMKFLVDIINGELKQSGILRVGTNKMLLEFLKRNLESDNGLDNIDSDIIVYGTTKASDEMMMSALEYIESLNYFKNIMRNDLGGVISAYGTENLTGISYVLKKK